MSILLTIGLYLTVGVTAACVIMGGCMLAWDVSGENKIVAAAFGTPLATFVFVCSVEFLRII